VIWLLAIGEGISAKAQEQIEGLGANNIIVVSDRPPTESNEKRYDPYGVTQNDYERLIKLVPSIVKAAPVREQNRMELKYRDRLVMSRMVGCTAEYLDVNQLELKQGHFLSAPDLKSANKMCAISDSVAQQLFPIEDPIGKSVKLQGYYFRVIGVIAEKAESEGIDDKLRSHDFSDDIYIPLSVVQELFANSYSQTYSGVPIVGQVTLQLRDKSEVLQTAEIVRKSLEQWHDMEDYELVVPMELLNQARSTRLMFICLMSMVAAISLLVGGIGIMNIMLSSVTERTREIGIRRALGAKQKDITRQFLVETVVLSILGGLTGVLGGLTCKLIIENLRLFLETSFPEMMASMPESLQSVTPIVVTWSIPVAFGISVLVGVVFGMYPAGRAAAMKPIDALRHVA
jgi:ABC-type antimicrobial peptide transport system permease subunit